MNAYQRGFLKRASAWTAAKSAVQAIGYRPSYDVEVKQDEDKKVSAVSPARVLAAFLPKYSDRYRAIKGCHDKNKKFLLAGLNAHLDMKKVEGQPFKSKETYGKQAAELQPAMAPHSLTNSLPVRPFPPAPPTTSPVRTLPPFMGTTMTGGTR